MSGLGSKGNPEQTDIDLAALATASGIPLSAENVNDMTPEEKAGLSITIQNQGMAEEGQAAMMEIQAQQLEQADRVIAMQEESWDFYNTFYKPMEMAFATEAFEPTYVQKGIESAAAGVRQAFSQQQQQVARQMESLGIDPSSPKYQSVLKDADIARAAAEAGARNAARTQGLQEQYAKQTQAVALGKGLPSEAATFAATATPSLTGAASTTSGAFGIGQQGYQNTMGMLNQWTANDLAQQQSKDAATAAMWAGIGQLGGSAMEAAAMA